MKRFASACFILLLAILFMASGNDAMAQSIKIKKVAQSLNQAPKGTKWSIINGLRVVGKGCTAIFALDTTGSGATGTAAWSISGKPANSAAALDSTDKFQTSFKVDSTGFYYVTVNYGGKTAVDTLYASTYVGVGADAQAGCMCHSTAASIKSEWAVSNHATIFNRGISGQLEVIAEMKAGLYKESCIQCHTVGFDVNMNNGNFGYLAHRIPAASPASWDSTWFAGLTRLPDGSGDLLIPVDSAMSRVAALPAQLQGLNTIGCESCHGPAAGHKSFTQPMNRTIAKSYDAGVCNQCHDGSGRHSIGGYFNLSAHALPPSEARVNCAPCHQGATFVKWINNNKDTTGFAASVTTAELNTSITCVACHDPHSMQLRQVSVDSLRNGFKFAAAGKSQVCSYCHSSRYSVTKRVTTSGPYYGFVDRFGPHENPQYDMLVGGNGYEYGDAGISGIATHKNLEDGCVTCHMQGRVRSGNTLANHSMAMAGDTAYGFAAVTVCKQCHGDIEDFDGVKALYDYDGNGKIEGVQTEVQGLLNRLKARLPVDNTGEPVTMMKDSLTVKNHPELVQAIWDYYFVKNDGSLGIHNTKYAVALLQKALGTYPLDVKTVTNTIPDQFTLGQNYPNPFNPSTTISFAVPQSSQVKLEVYDILGNLVKTMVNQQMGAGTYQVVWNGVDKNGAKVASGMYLYRLQAGSFTSVKKMLMLK